VSAPLRTGLRDAPRSALVVLAAVAAAVGLCAGCNYGEVVVVQPAATGRGPLTLSIQADPEDTAAARELGWSAGIPGAEVTITSGGGDTAVGPPVAVVQTDGSGKVSVTDLPDGKYFVQVRRLLTSSEMAKLAASDDAVGFMTQTVVVRGSETVFVPASRRHSVVISEWAFSEDPITGYIFGGFLELVNNSDTTVYLDGLVIGEGFAQAADFVPGRCAQFEGWTNDPDGIWSRYFDSLPGTGHDYPLAPGATAVIATDAIDHSGMVSGGLDLRGANFEFVGTADADNPGVPNTVSIGPTPYWFGHGLFLNELLDEVVFVALPVDVAALPRERTPQDQNEYARVPRDRMLDVIALLSVFQFPEPLCPHLVHRNFDRYRARLMQDDMEEFFHSISRKVAYTRADGRKILQHTRTSNTDLFLGPRTPGQLP
jgi:hypothetical protein